MKKKQNFVRLKNKAFILVYHILDFMRGWKLLENKTSNWTFYWN